MIYFIYGTDTYRLKKTIDAMREKYEDESGMNSSLFEGDYDIEKIRSDVKSLPFLSSKRLVIIKNILSAKGVDSKKVIDILDKKPDSTVMLFIEEGEPDKRTALYKRLVKEKSKELKPLQGGELIKWIKAEAERNGGQVETKEALVLAGYYGGDLWQLKNEIQKLVSYAQKITEENIEKLSVANINVKIFDLTDAITAGNRKKALKILGDLLDSGENELYILSMIQWQVRNLALVYDLKNLSEQDIARKAKLNPYIVKKTLFATRLLCLPRTSKQCAGHSRPPLPAPRSLDEVGSFPPPSVIPAEAGIQDIRRINSGGNPQKDVNSDSGFETIKNYYSLVIGAENDIKTGAKEPDVALELLINKLTN